LGSSDKEICSMDLRIGAFHCDYSTILTRHPGVSKFCAMFGRLGLTISILTVFCFTSGAFADVLPTLELVSPYASYSSGNALNLSVRLSLSASATHGWTVTSASDGALTVLHLRNVTVVRRGSPRTDVSPVTVDSSPNSTIFSQQMAGRLILEPGKSLELRLTV